MLHIPLSYLLLTFQTLAKLTSKNISSTCTKNLYSSKINLSLQKYIRRRVGYSIHPLHGWLYDNYLALELFHLLEFICSIHVNETNFYDLMWNVVKLKFHIRYDVLNRLITHECSLINFNDKFVVPYSTMFSFHSV